MNKAHKEERQQQSRKKLQLADFVISYPVPDNFLKEIRRLTKMVRKAENIIDLVTHNTANTIIQHLLYALYMCIPSLCNKLVLSILKSGGNDGDTTTLSPLFSHVSGSYIMEVILSIASPDMLDTLYTQCFEKRVSAIAIHPQANFVLQRFLELSNGSHIGPMVAELKDLEDVMYNGHYGVVVRLLQCGIKCPEYQPLLLDLLMKAFHLCDHPNDCLIPMVMLTTSEIYKKQKDDYVSLCCYTVL